MSRRATPVTTTVSSDGEETIYEHPSFGVIELTQPHGSSGRLFGSPVADHPVYMKMRIYRGGVERHRYHETNAVRGFGGGPTELVCELRMSQAQWVQMIMSAGNGQGTPCTLGFTENAGNIPEPAPAPAATEVHRAAESIGRAANVARRAVDALETALVAALRDEGVSGAKAKRILSAVEAAQRGLSNVSFSASQIEEAAAKVVHAAKVEAETVLATTAQRVGFARLEQVAAAGRAEVGRMALPLAEQQITTALLKNGACGDCGALVTTEEEEAAHASPTGFACDEHRARAQREQRDCGGCVHISGDGTLCDHYAKADAENAAVGVRDPHASDESEALGRRVMEWDDSGEDSGCPGFEPARRGGAP